MAREILNQLLEQGSGDDVAVVVPGGASLTYSKLREQVAFVAEALARLGLGRGDRIALVLPNSAESIVLFLAAATTGTAAPLNAAYKEDEFRFYLEDIEARALVVPPGQGEAARRAAPAGAAMVEASLDSSGRMVLESPAPRARRQDRPRTTLRSSSTPAARRAGRSSFRSGSATSSSPRKTSRARTASHPMTLLFA